MCIYKCMLNVYKNQQNRQTRSRNLMGPKTLPMIWGTYMKFVTKYQISAINSCWEKCDEKWAYMFNVYTQFILFPTANDLNTNQIHNEKFNYIKFWCDLNIIIRIECILLKFYWGMKALIELHFQHNVVVEARASSDLSFIGIWNITFIIMWLLHSQSYCNISMKNWSNVIIVV
jgi:hypothetical protein